MGLPVRENSPDNMPSAQQTQAPLANGPPKIVANGTATPDAISANDNIRRFDASSRVMSPLQNVLFHNKTRCFV
jgi:hypothetical protein